MQGGHQSFLRWLALALLLAGIVLHGIQVVAHDEDPQRGSAFAMFATVDIGATRRVLATVPEEPGLILEIPDELRDESGELADSPDSDAARSLAEELLELSWTIDDDKATEGGPRTFDAVRLQLVRLEVDGRKLSSEVLVDEEVTAAQP
jgi:hypothetical protein